MLNHQGTVPLTGERLVLRPYRLEDAPAMYQNWCSDPEVCRFLTWHPHQDVAETEALLSLWVPAYCQDACYRWGITLDGELIGNISVVRWNERNVVAELGYCLGRQWWGQGYMTEAFRLVIDFLFQQVGFRRIAMRHARENIGSGRVMQKAGLKYEGCMLQAERLLDGSFADICLYGLLNENWKETAPS